MKELEELERAWNEEKGNMGVMTETEERTFKLIFSLGYLIGSSNKTIKATNLIRSLKVETCQCGKTTVNEEERKQCA